MLGESINLSQDFSAHVSVCDLDLISAAASMMMSTNLRDSRSKLVTYQEVPS